MRLNDDELREVLARAQEIQRTALVGPEARRELDVVIQAAEEVGIPREAVERALRERLGLPARVPQQGELAFARSADGKYYVAEVLSVAPDQVRVRFLRGSEHVLPADEVRPAAFLPGEKVMVHWPWWGPWECTVISFDAGERTAKVTDGWAETKTFPLSDIWVNAPKSRMPGTRRRIYLTLLGAGAGIGAAIGAILTAVLMR